MHIKSNDKELLAKIMADLNNIFATILLLAYFIHLTSADLNFCVDENDWQPIEDLQKKLGLNNWLRAKKRTIDERKVAQLLAKTKDKSLPGTILNKFSVDDMLDLNDLFPEQCTKNELRRRLHVKEQLSVNKHLYNYAEWCMAGFSEFCKSKSGGIMEDNDKVEHVPMARLNIEPHSHKRLLHFSEKVHRLSSWPYKTGVSDEQSVKNVLETMDEAKKEKLAGSCRLLIEQMEEKRNDPYRADRPTNWDVQYKLCLIFEQMISIEDEQEDME